MLWDVFLHHLGVSHGVRDEVKLLRHVLEVQVSLSLPIGLQQLFFATVHVRVRPVSARARGTSAE